MIIGRYLVTWHIPFVNERGNKTYSSHAFFVAFEVRVMVSV